MGTRTPCAQIYPGLEDHERTTVEEAAVRMVSDYVPPEDEAMDGSAAALDPEAEHACQLLTSLCTKRVALMQRFFVVYTSSPPCTRVRHRAVLVVAARPL